MNRDPRYIGSFCRDDDKYGVGFPASLKSKRQCEVKDTLLQIVLDGRVECCVNMRVL
jgi:hypothetical protein